MWKEYQNRYPNRKACDPIWRIRLNSLPIGSRLRHWNIPNRTAEFCGFCPGVIQNHAHLFWSCPVAQQLWNAIGTLAAIAWPKWNLHNNPPSYEDLLWGMPASGFNNNNAEQAWKCYVECAIRALRIARYNNKLSNANYNVAIVASTFLALLSATLDLVYLDLRSQNKDTTEFIRE